MGSLSGWDQPGYYAAQLAPEQVPLTTTERVAEPGIVQPRPLTLGDVLGGAFRAVRFAPVAMFGITLAVMLVAQLIAAGVGYLASREFTTLLPTDDSEFGGFDGLSGLLGWTMLTSVAATSLATVVLEAGLAYAVHEAVFGRRATPADTLRRLLSRVWAVLGYTALVSIGAGVVAIIFSVALASELNANRTAWVLVAIVPATIALAAVLGVRLMLAPAVIAIERLGPIRAIRRSWQLSRGQFWRLLGISVLATVIISMAASTVSSVFSFAGMMIGLANLAVAMIASTTASTLVSSMLSVPLSTAVTTLLYVDMRIRAEGYDLQIAESLYG